MSYAQREIAANEAQFARLIDEASAAGAFSPQVLADMVTSMDLSKAEVLSVIEYAAKRFETVKEKPLPSRDVQDFWSRATL